MSNADDNKLVLKSNQTDQNEEGFEVYDKDKLQEEIRENVRKVKETSNQEVEQEKEKATGNDNDRLIEKVDKEAEELDKKSRKIETRNLEKRKRRAASRRQKKRGIKREKRRKQEEGELGPNLDLSPMVSKLIVLKSIVAKHLTFFLFICDLLLRMTLVSLLLVISSYYYCWKPKRQYSSVFHFIRYSSLLKLDAL